MPKNAGFLREKNTFCTQHWGPSPKAGLLSPTKTLFGPPNTDFQKKTETFQNVRQLRRTKASSLFWTMDPKSFRCFCTKNFKYFSRMISKRELGQNR